MRRAYVRRRRGCVAVAGVAAAVAAAAGVARAAPVGYLASTWSDSAVHFLDSNLNNLSSFDTGASFPNDVVASDGHVIYTCHFTTAQVFAYDFDGNILFSWSDPRLSRAQGLALVNGKLAVADGGTNAIDFYNPTTGAYLSTFADAGGTGGSSDAIAFDGSVLWEVNHKTALVGNKLVNTDTIVGVNPTTNAIIRVLPDAATGENFGGTGLAAPEPGVLVVAGNHTTSGTFIKGDWYEISSVDGHVITTGNNGLDMFGLAAIPLPEPASAATAAAAVGLLLARRRTR